MSIEGAASVVAEIGIRCVSAEAEVRTLKGKLEHEKQFRKEVTETLDKILHHITYLKTVYCVGD